MSRGAQIVYFFENYKNTLKILHKNINKLNLDRKVKIVEKSVFELKNINFGNTKFEIIFIDPPFLNKDLDKIINEISFLKITKPETVVIIHRSKKTKDVISEKFSILREKIFGLSKIYFGRIT